MDLVLWTILLVLSLIFVTLGLFKNEHTELSIVGFLFLFLLSVQILTTDITYVVGTETNMTYVYSGGNLTKTVESSYDVYDNITADSTLTRMIGIYMAIASVVGFVGVMASLRRAW